MYFIGFTQLVVILLVAGVVFVWPVWRILTKAGYPGALALALVVPGVNIALLFFLAFSEWPVLSELKELRRRFTV